MSELSTECPTGEIQDKLLLWFAVNGRDLPWRKTYSPYHVWISEVMLQQTQMDRVVTYFNSWIERFPDITSIAEASEEEVLRYWEGLGYYNRARNLQRTARLLQDNGYRLPTSHQALLRLPGIGKYTAGAIMSIAFNHDHPVVDANIERLFARLYNLERPVKDGASQRFLWETAARLIPQGRAREFNQALMELGALLCLPARPLCPSCPVRTCCRSHALGIVDERPLAGKSSDIIKINMATGVLVADDLVFIQKRPLHGVWGGLWEFPGGRIEKGERPRQALVREYLEETEMNIRIGKKITVIKHAYTRYRVTLHCYFCTPANGQERPVIHEALEYRWVRFTDLANYGFPSPHRQLIDYIERNR